jgi:hypothetical protein
MAIPALRVRAPEPPYRECEIVIDEPEDQSMLRRAICTDVATGLVIDSPPVPQVYGQQEITAAEAIRMIGATHRLASIVVDIGTQVLARQTVG